MCRIMRKPCGLEVRRYAACMIDIKDYLDFFPGAKASEKNCETELNEILLNSVNYRVTKTVRHRTSLHRICPKLLIDLSPSRLESQTSFRQTTVKLFGLSPIRLKSQTSVRRPALKIFVSSPSCLSFDQNINC